MPRSQSSPQPSVNHHAATPYARKRDRFLPSRKPHPRSPSPGPSSSVSQLAAPPIPSPTDLWAQAYHKLPDELKQHLRVNNHGAADKLQVLQNVLETANQAKEASMAKRLTFKWGDKEINVRETASRLVGWITKFKEIGDIAVQYDPVHAALPWAGVRFILLLAVGDQERLGAAIVGMERVAVVIDRCAIFERLYLTGNVPESVKEATENLRRAFLSLYTAILHALCRLIRVFKGKFSDKLKSPESTLAEISGIDEPESTVDSAVVALENCYHAAARQHNEEGLHKLLKLFNDLMPAIDRIDRIDRNVEETYQNMEDIAPVISTINMNVDAIYKNIEENKRINILRWFSTVPYQSHHDLACEGRVEHTGSWLFKRPEFTSWESSKEPTILWLHGIPGAGKTKLVSATIEYLNSTARFDKIAYFYCKRDEADRRDREKILLSLIKQLACPPPNQNIDNRICAHAVDAYNKEHKDPDSRHHLNFDASHTLLGRLVECFQHPAIVLDALDECSAEVRGQLLRVLLSLRGKTKCAFKVFISSRHNLDIEDHLRNLPHVCIEARDNAEDIRNYVQSELTLAIQHKRLLRGKVSQDLKRCMEEVILRDANGMFLWVDWQLRELCKLMLESDIRTRLGRLPKGLSGVYDEIIDLIKSQPDCNFNLAMHALNWMMVSQRPLEPQELVAAAELNPSSIPVEGSAPSQESTLEIDLLIQSCEGLLLLDTTLGVVRFSHLSVQEYLETRNEIIKVIDAQLFVSESCLWTLQYANSVSSPLYKYAALNWDRHCKSYEDLALTTVNFGDTMHELSIPLLDSFLGSFKEASISYVKWVDWIIDYEPHFEYYDVEDLRTTPLSPVFSAAFAGLGELVSWLWNPEANDMKIKNDYGISLLAVASRYGKTWVVAKMLKVGFEIDTVDEALFYACRAGKLDTVKLLLAQGANVNKDYHDSNPLVIAAGEGYLEVVTLLLDRGADINVTGDPYGTALGAAACGGSLEIAKLLLDRGADINVTGGHYGTALGAAARGGRLEIAKLLLDRGADINVTGGHYGTALGAAACGGSLEMVIFLLDRGADINVTGSEYGTALGAAARWGSLEIAKLLLDRGVDINVTGGHYGTALGAAVWGGSLEIAKLLLDRGADINVTGGHYGTALGAAACRGSLEIAKLLLDRGADINLTGGRYGSALGAAASRGCRDIVTLLLGKGADINMTNYEGARPLDLAEKEGYQDIIIMLLDEEANLYLTDCESEWPIDSAEQEAHQDVMDLFYPWHVYSNQMVDNADQMDLV